MPAGTTAGSGLPCLQCLQGPSSLAASGRVFSDFSISRFSPSPCLRRRPLLIPRAIGPRRFGHEAPELLGEMALISEAVLRRHVRE